MLCRDGLGRGCGMWRARRWGSGFTLIEILIVISIIALLGSLILVGVNAALKSASEATCQMEITALNGALQQYVQDESEYPGGDEEEFDEDTNHFPLLYKALFGRRRPAGPGGRSAPYTKLEESKIRVYNPDTELYELPSRRELRDDDVEKFLIDPWDNPYIYRANKGRSEEDYMHNLQDADIYSLGPNENDDTVEGTEGEENDDLGNW